MKKEDIDDEGLRRDTFDGETKKKKYVDVGQGLWQYMMRDKMDLDKAALSKPKFLSMQTKNSQ